MPVLALCAAVARRRAARGQAAAALRSARIGLDRAGRRRRDVHLPRGILPLAHRADPPPGGERRQVQRPLRPLERALRADVAEVIIAKQRHGPIGTVKLHLRRPGDQVRQPGARRSDLPGNYCRDDGTLPAPFLTIDLGAVVANWRLLATRLDEAECAAVVKADAYGLGVARVAPALARRLPAASSSPTLDEGHRAAPAARRVIHVLNGAGRRAAGEFIRAACARCSTAWRRSPVGPVAAAAPAALHIDTGINRLGLSPDEAARLAAEPQRLAGLTLQPGDEPSRLRRRARTSDEQPSVARSAPRWPSSISPARPAQPRRLLRHLPRPRFHRFRDGPPRAALYGLAPLAGHPNPMAQVIRLQGKILQVRRN